MAAFNAGTNGGFTIGVRYRIDGNSDGVYQDFVRILASNGAYIKISSQVAMKMGIEYKNPDGTDTTNHSGSYVHWGPAHFIVRVSGTTMKIYHGPVGSLASTTINLTTAPQNLSINSITIRTGIFERWLGLRSLYLYPRALSDSEITTFNTALSTDTGYPSGEFFGTPNISSALQPNGSPATADGNSVASWGGFQSVSGSYPIISTGDSLKWIRINQNSTVYMTATSFGSGGGAPAPAPAPATVPGAPTGVTAVAGNGQATVSWTAPASNGGSAIITYTVTSTPGGFIGETVNNSGATSVVVSGLTNGVSYTFKVKAINSVGTGPESVASAAVVYNAASVINGGSNALTTYIGASTATSAALAKDVRAAIKALPFSTVSEINAKKAAKLEYIAAMRTKVGASNKLSVPSSDFTDYLATFDASVASLSAKAIDVFLPDASNVIDISSAASTNYSALEMPIDTPVTIKDGSTTLGTLTYNGTSYSDGTNTYNVGDSIVFGTKQITVLGRGSVLATIANTYTSVEVNLNVVITADGELQLLSQQFTAPDNVVDATQTLPANCLYDVTSAPSNPLGLIEFWEPTGVDDIECQLATSYKTSANVEAYKVIAGKLVKGLQDVLIGELNASNAVPFSSYSDNGNKIMIGFGRLALMSYAHYIMGHVQATAAITNDTAFIRSMLSLDANDAYRYTVTNGSVGDYNASATSGAWFDAGDKTNANLAARLVKMLITNNASSSLTSNPGATSVANIVKQVIGQDASRARGEDNSKYLPDNKGLLRFYAGDKIYVAISLEVPTVSVSSGQLVGQSTLQPLYTPTLAQKKYNLKITLS
jgi:hypothetical protein